MTERKTITLGTDTPLANLMRLSGSSLLKLLGMTATQAEQYHFRATVLKEKRLLPDIEGLPMLESEHGRVFVEFQGYSDPFIRYRLLSEIFLACTQDQYHGLVFAAIVYTEEKYQEAALPLSLFGESKSCRWQSCFRELVLTDCTEAGLLAIDPKLVILAPFTLPKTTAKATLLVKGPQWKTQVEQVFPPERWQEALDVLGLLILNRFAKLTYQEVIAMLNFDLMATVAGQQLYEMGEHQGLEKGLEKGIEKGRQEGRQEGLQKGLKKGHQAGLLEDAREMVIAALEERFGLVPMEIRDRINALTHREILRNLFKQALRCADLDNFKEMLSKV